MFGERRDPWSVFMVAAKCFAEVMFRANKQLGLDLEDKTALLKLVLKMWVRRRGVTREHL